MRLLHRLIKIKIKTVVYTVYLRAIIRSYSVLAQLVEQMAVNHRVAGSSPAHGAKMEIIL